MWVRATNRRDLIDIVQVERSYEPADRLFSGYEFSAVSSLTAPNKSDEFLLVWQDDPREVLTLPALIVTVSEQRDFFAWASTYLNTLRPLTAYIRVSSYHAAEQALKLQTPPTLHRLESACAGLILGETATYLDGRRDLMQVPARTCAGTYSFVMARALGLGVLVAEKSEISSAWFEARELTRQSNLPLSRSVLQAPWFVLLGLENGTWKSDPSETQLSRPVLDACLDLYLKGEVDNRQWQSLEPEAPGVGDLGDMMRGPREDRVVALEEIASKLRRRAAATPPVSLSFVLGYCASQIAPGTMDHLQLLAPYVHDFPGVLMWYGLCAGLHRRSTVGSYAGGLGRRTIREVLREEALLDRPTCDVGLAELQILNSKERGRYTFRTNSSAQIEVELAPCISATFRWPPRTEVSEPPLSPSKVTADAVEPILSDLERTTEELLEISARLGRLTNRREIKRPRKDRRPRQN